jgi:hypothetical protein
MPEHEIDDDEAVGSVRLASDQLVVAAPASIDDEAWRTIAETLTRLPVERAGEAALHGRQVAVPRAAGRLLRTALAEQWPASRWRWEWTTAADAAVGRDDEIGLRLRAVLRPSTSADDVVGDADDASVPGFRRPLLAFQRGPVDRLVAAGSGANFSVPGAGKTAMTFAVWARLRRLGEVDRMLVVAPLSAHEAWSSEAASCFRSEAAPGVALRPRTWLRDTEVIVVTYERLQDPRALAEAARWCDDGATMLVLDEAHRAKAGARGVRGAACRRLARMAAARYVLTGTPMPNGRGDLAAILDLAWPGHGSNLAVGPLATVADRTWVRVTKPMLGLPPMRLTVERVELEPGHRLLYRALTADVREQVELEALVVHPELALRATQRMLAMASNPAAVLRPGTPLEWSPTHPGEVVGPRLPVPTELRPSKLLRAAQIVADNAQAGRKTLVWTNFVANVEALGLLLSRFAPALVTGAVPVEDDQAPTDRARELARFRHDPSCSVLIATPQTLGEGVNLQHVCQDQVWVDRGFNAGTYLQALDRTHRIGMPADRDGRATILVARDTIDERVDVVLAQKLARMEASLADPALGQLRLPDLDYEITLEQLLTGDEGSRSAEELLHHLL